MAALFCQGAHIRQYLARWPLQWDRVVAYFMQGMLQLDAGVKDRSTGPCARHERPNLPQSVPAGILSTL